jgi:hypothetical protein
MMGEQPSMVITILNPNTDDLDAQAVSIYGKIVHEDETDPVMSVYHLVDPAGVDDSVLRVTIYAGPGSERRE